MLESEIETSPFGAYEEKVIVSLAFDAPEFYMTIAKNIEPKDFSTFETKFLITIIHDYINKKDIIPTREIIYDRVTKILSANDNCSAVLELINRRSNPREVKLIKSIIIDWARSKAFGKLYDDEALTAYEKRDFSKLEKIFDEATKITENSGKGLWFFNSTDILFEESFDQKLTTGFTKLDHYLNDGGPSKKEVLCYAANTGVGKSIALVNSAVANIKKSQKILHFSLEMSDRKTAQRYASCFANIKINEHKKHRDSLTDKLSKIKSTYAGDLVIYEFPPDEISVNEIYQTTDSLQRLHNWKPDVIVIDYLECMLSRRKSDNENDYLKQKNISTQIRGLAKNLDVLVLTATQTNREPGAGKDSKKKDDFAPAGLNRLAESYGKSMPMDYVVTINQSKDEYKSEIPKLRLFIAKNRNGKKEVSVTVNMNYEMMKMQQEEVEKI